MRRYLVFGVASAAMALSGISGTTVSVAFPVITTDFNTSIILAGWVLNAFQLTATITLPLAGKLSDMLSRRFTFILFLLLFTVGSLLCAIAPNIELLIVFRIIQGIGGGGFLPCSVGIISDEFPEQRQRYIGFLSSIYPIGTIVGPNLGGWMVGALGWRSIFWLNVPLGLVMLVLARTLFRAEKKSGAGHSIDFTGAGLLLGSVFAIMFGLTEAGNDFRSNWPFISILLAVGIVFMIAFVRRERRAKEPVIDLTILSKGPFLAGNLNNFLYGFAALGIYSLVPLYAVSVYHMSTFASGAILTPRSVTTIIVSFITSMSLMTWGYRWPMLIGTLTMALGVFLLAFETQGIQILGIQIGFTPLLLVIIGIAGIGHGICNPASSNACIELMPEKAASITGLRSMFRHMGSVLGVAVATIILNSVGDVQRAFTIIWIMSGLVVLASIPTIFIMPKSPKDCAPEKAVKSFHV